MKLQDIDPAATYLIFYPWLDPKTVNPLREREIVTTTFVKINFNRASKSLDSMLRQQSKQHANIELKDLQLMSKYHFIWNDKFKEHMYKQRTRFIPDPFMTMFSLIDNQGYHSIIDSERAYQLLRPIVDIETKHVGSQLQLPVPMDSNLRLISIYQGLLQRERFDDLLKVIMICNGYYVAQTIGSLSNDVIQMLKSSDEWDRLNHMIQCDKLQLEFLDSNLTSDIELKRQLLYHQEIYIEKVRAMRGITKGQEELNEERKIRAEMEKVEHQPSRKAIRRKRRKSKTKRIGVRYCEIVKKRLVHYKISDDEEEVEHGSRREKEILDGIGISSNEENDY